MRTQPRAQRLAVVLTASVLTLLGLAAPANAADPAHDPILNCSFWFRYMNVLVYAGEAHVPLTHEPVATITLTCTFRNASGSYTATATGAGGAVTVAGSGLLMGGEMTVCESGEVRYVDGHVATVPERCGPDDPVETGPLPAPPDTATVQCDFARAAVPGTWVIDVVGIAGSPGDVPQTTAVSCALLDTGGVPMTVEGTQAGATAAASGVFVAPIRALVSKCTTMSVRYLSGARSLTACESF